MSGLTFHGQQGQVPRELSTITRSAGGGNSYETMSGIDYQQSAAMKILQASIPLEYGMNKANADQSMLMVSLNPSRTSNPRLSSLSATPVSSLRYPRLAMEAGKAPITRPVYGSNYWSISQGYEN